MNATAVRAVDLLCFHRRRLPALFFYCHSGIGELRRGRTAHEQAFNVKASLRF
jgi:hypothetical protein